MYKGIIHSADFEDNTITIEVKGEFRVSVGECVLLTIEEYNELSKLHQPDVSESVCNHKFDEYVYDRTGQECCEYCGEYVERKTGR